MASRLETHAQRGYMRPHVVSLWSVKEQTKTHFHKIILAQLSSSIYTHIHTHTDREKLCDRDDDDDDEGGIFIRLALWFSHVFSLLHLLLLPSVYTSIIFRRNHRAEKKKGTLVYIICYMGWDAADRCVCLGFDGKPHIGLKDMYLSDMRCVGLRVL